MTLEARFLEFVRNLKSAEIFDNLQLSQKQQQAKKPDFFFFERRFIGEMKSIKKDMEPKAQRILDKYKDKPEYPVFFGQWEANKVLKHLPDGESVNQKIFHAITSALEDGVEDANGQIRETKEVFELDDSEGILIILNDLIEILSPDIIMHKVHQMFNKKYQSGDVRYPHISIAWIISEIHVLETDSEQTLLPSIVVVNDRSPSWEAANDYVNWLQKKWASFNSIPLIESNLDIENIRFSKRKDSNSSEMLSQDEIWRRQYTKTPYLRNLGKEQLLGYGQQLWYKTLPAFIRGTHEKPSQEKVFELMEIGTHFIEEINHRGIDFREFSPELHKAFDMLQREGKLEL